MVAYVPKSLVISKDEDEMRLGAGRGARLWSVFSFLVLLWAVGPAQVVTEEEAEDPEACQSVHGLCPSDPWPQAGPLGHALWSLLGRCAPRHTCMG